jgi:hypothetical protein
LPKIFFVARSKIIYFFENMSLHQIAHIDEILDRIFVHLDTRTLVHKIQLVNKQWYKVAENHVDYNHESHLAIVSISRSGNLAAINKLLQNPKVNLGTRGNSILLYASEHGQLAVVNRALEDPRVDPSIHNNTAVHGASMFGHLAVVERLL